MARLQILELPMVHNGDQTETPFILVIDQVSDETAQDIANWPKDISTRLGARHVLCFGETVDIPANDLGTYNVADGQEVHLKLDDHELRAHVQDEIGKAQAATVKSLRDA